MNKKKLIASLSCIALSFTTAFSGQMYTVRVDANVEETVDTWTDVGKYTKAWYNPATEQDICKNLGNKDDPYEIRNATDLAAYSYYSNASTNIGGLIGYHNDSGEEISNCNTHITIESFVNSNSSYTSNIGGIVGFVDFNMDMSNCEATGTITTSSYYRNGGAIGFDQSLSNLNDITTNVLINAINKSC